MYLGEWQIDDVLTFTVTTHTFSTGAATDADAVPAYRVYEDETGTAILTGNMALLDDANTVGHYSEQITLSAANGFEEGKSYSIYISAAVSSVTGTTVRSFQVEAAKATAAALATIDDFLDTEVAAILEDTGTTLPATLSTLAGYIDTEVAAILAAVDTEVAAIKAKTDNLPAAPAATGDIPTAAAVADAVWDESLAAHLTAGSTGEGLNAAGSAGDPWATTLPGAYGAGTAGKIVGDNLDATVGSRLASASYAAPLDAAGTRTAVGLAAANLDTQLGDLPTSVELANELSGLSTLTAADVTTALQALVIDGTITWIQMQRIVLAFAAGETTGGGTNNPAFLGQDGATERIDATMDANGNRTAVTLNGA